MYLPVDLPDTNTRAMVDSWRGYNHNYRIGAGEFYDMENLCSDYYPLAVPRKKRSLLVEDDHVYGVLLTDNRLTFLTANCLHYGNKVYDLSAYTSRITEEQQLLRFGAYVLIFPSGIYINLTDDNDIGTMDAKYQVPAGKTINYQMCDVTGSAYANITAGTTAPASPADGDYWLNTTEGAEGLNIWVDDQHMWQPVATTYVKISISGADLKSYFEEGDTVTFNGKYPDLTDMTIIKLDDTYMVVTGIIPAVSDTDTTDSTYRPIIERKLPTLDYVCASNNRIWGCHYGSDGTGGVYNEIYASTLGNFKNWYTYEGLSTDAYSVSVGEEGPWTGCITYQGRPTFFKENAIFRIYGSYPAEYQLVINNIRGVQQGSSKSLAIVNEYLVYKSSADIVIYDGATPTSISQALGRDKMYYDAVAGGTLNKYYIAMQDTIGNYYYFVYDMANNLWMRESPLAIRQFTSSEGGQIYAHTDTQIYGIGAADNMAYFDAPVGEEYVSWWAETGDIGFEYPDLKRVSKITLRAYVPFRSEIQVLISYDDMPYVEKAVMRGNDELRSQVISIQPMRCDHYRIKFVGHGDCRIYTMTTTLETEAGEYA